MPDSPTKPPDLLDLYRLAVQHPLAEVAFIEHCWAHYGPERPEPMLLREDFAGTCAVSAAWCASDPDRQAMAIEIDSATANWAAERFDDPDLHIVVEDVLAVDEPAVDVTAALNFSILIYHDQPALQGYLTHAIKGLKPGGLLVLDLFGGSAVHRPVVQGRHVEPDEAGIEPFQYLWDQRGVDPKTRKIDCRIHFELGDDRRLEDAFTYDWRLWHPVEVVAAAKEAGFAQASLWWSPPGSSGRHMPVEREPDAADWVAYVVCVAPA